MTVQEATAVLDAVDTKRSFSVRGLGGGKLGDIVLKVVAGLVLLYIFIPIFVIVLFSFNKPAGKFNYTWQGFTLDNWADPFKYPALAQALKLSVEVAAISTAIAVVPEHDPSGRQVLVRGVDVQLTVREFDLLMFFISHPGQVFSRNQLMDAVWQYSFYTDTSTVTVHIRRLRQKLEHDPGHPRHLETVWGVGYRFAP